MPLPALAPLVSVVVEAVGSVLATWLAISSLTELIDRIRNIRSEAYDAVFTAVENGIYAAIARVSSDAGFPLDATNPFSGESIAGAINHRLGEEVFSNVLDVPKTKREAVEYGIAKAEEATGLEMPDDPLDAGQWWDSIASNVVSAAAAEAATHPNVCNAVAVIQGALCTTPACTACSEGGAEECEERRKKDRSRTKKCKRG